MPLVNMKVMLEKAKEGKYAVGQFNINNLEWTQGILTAAEEKQAPVILGVSEGAARYMVCYYTLFYIVEGLMFDMNISVPFAIHLFHCSSIEKCVEAIDSGFSSVMIDASHHPFAENVEITREVVEYAHSRGCSVEAELGTVGGQEDDVVGEVMYAKKDECVELAKLTKIDCLAPALGSVHGPYKGEPKLGFDEMLAIKEATNLPLVLHGGTGIPVEQIKKAIERGTCKINVNTENQQIWTKTVREVIANDQKVYDPRKIIGPGIKAMTEVVKEKIEMFGSAGKASDVI